MKYISQIDKNFKVINCIQIPDSIENPIDFYSGKLLGIWKIGRSNIGDIYDETRDAFIPPKPYPSWTLNEETCLWESPVPHPNDGQIYNWNEETQTWDLVSNE